MGGVTTGATCLLNTFPQHFATCARMLQLSVTTLHSASTSSEHGCCTTVGCQGRCFPGQRRTLREQPDTNLGKMDANVSATASSDTPATSLANCSAAGTPVCSSARAMPAKPSMAMRPLKRCKERGKKVEIKQSKADRRAAQDTAGQQHEWQVAAEQQCVHVQPRLQSQPTQHFNRS